MFFRNYTCKNSHIAFVLSKKSIKLEGEKKNENEKTGENTEIVDEFQFHYTKRKFVLISSIFIPWSDKKIIVVCSSICEGWIFIFNHNSFFANAYFKFATSLFNMLYVTCISRVSVDDEWEYFTIKLNRGKQFEFFFLWIFV